MAASQHTALLLLRKGRPTWTASGLSPHARAKQDHGSQPAHCTLAAAQRQAYLTASGLSPHARAKQDHGSQPAHCTLAAAQRQAYLTASGPSQHARAKQDHGSQPAHCTLAAAQRQAYLTASGLSPHAWARIMAASRHSTTRMLYCFGAASALLDTAKQLATTNTASGGRTTSVARTCARNQYDCWQKGGASMLDTGVDTCKHMLCWLMPCWGYPACTK